MSVLLCVICLIWLAFIQQKLDGISKSVDFLLKNLEKTSQTDISPNVELTPVKSQSVMPQEGEVSEPQRFVPPEDKSAISKSVSQYNLHETNSKTDFEFQSAFLGNIFNKIGALAIIIAVVIFIKLVSPFIVITPVMKVVLGYLAGLGMFGGALHLHRKDNMKNYSEVLLGTGFADLFITTFCAYSMFNLISTPAVIIVGGLLLVSTFVLAQKMKTVSMLVIGLIGGYLTPCFSGAPYETCLWYLIFLNLVSLVFTLRNTHYNFINFVNLIITMFAFLPYVIEPVRPVFPFTLWGCYIVYDFLRDKSSKAGYALNIMNYLVLTLFSLILFNNIHTTLGYVLFGTAFVYIGLARYSLLVKNNLYKTYIYYVLGNLWLGIIFLLNDVYSVISWSVIGFLITVVVAKYKQKYLTAAIHWFFSTAFVGALLAKFGSDFCMFAHYTPFINIRTLVFGVPVVLMLISSYLLKDENKNVYNLLQFSGISLGYLYFIGEINSLLSKTGGDINFNKWMLYIIIGFVYSLQAKRIYRQNNYLLFDVASWIMYIVSTLVLIGWSYIYPENFVPIMNLRCAAYLTGITASIIFARWMKSDILKYIAVILGFFFIHCESVGLSNAYENISFIISLAWVLYSGGITICGILLNRRYLINSGIFIIILTIFRIFIFDLAKVEALYKLIAFLALGIILMLVSYIYTANQKKLK